MRAGGWVAGLVLALVLAFGHELGAAEWAEVRVLSGAPGPATGTTVTLRASPDVEIEDRTTGAKPTTKRTGPASTGETFTGEMTLFLRGYTIPRPASIEVDDPVVSAVRLFPEPGGTTATVFVRQPVMYTVARPSAIGEVRIDLRSRTRAATVRALPGRPGRPRVVRPKVVGEPEVAVDAESLSYDQQSNTLTARGGVTLTRGDTVLTADEVVYDRTNGIAEARGHVVLTDPQATVTGDFAHLNMDDESGWIEDTTASLQPSGYTLRGGRVDKLGGPIYRVDQGVFTTCNCGGIEKPSWSIAGAHTDVDREGRGIMKGMTFRVKDVPVLWLPFFVFPANNNRQSGLLFPRVGQSATRGYQLFQPLYWAINKSADATLALDVETKARIGFVGEFRYALSRRSRGFFSAAYYNEENRTASVPPPGVGTDRFALIGGHNQPFLWNSRFYLDFLAVSDNQFLREINGFPMDVPHDFAIRSLRYTTSETGLYRKLGPNGQLWLEGVYHQDLIDPQEFTFQRLPRLEAQQSKALFGDWLVGRVFGEAVHYHRDTGYKGFRGELAPELFLPLHLGRIVSGSLTGQVRETVYHLTDDQQIALVAPDPGVPVAQGFRRAPELPRLDRDRTREIGLVRAQLGTEFERVFDFRHLGLEKLKHTVEPEVQYLYVPQVGRPTFTRALPVCSSLPGQIQGVNCNATLFSEGFLFDERDAINRRNFFSAGITTRLFGRGATPEEDVARRRAAGEEVESPKESPKRRPPALVSPPRELFRASILQGYDVTRELAGTSHLSDTDLLLRLTPVPGIGLGYDTTFSVEDQSVRAINAGLQLSEPWRPPTSTLRTYQAPTSLSLGYHFIPENVDREIHPNSPESRILHTGGLNYIDGAIYLRLSQYVGFAFVARYTLNETPQPPKPPLGPHFNERDYVLRIISPCNCWILEAGVVDTISPKESANFRVQLTLVGLGSVGQAPYPDRFLPGVSGLPGIRGRVGGISGGGFY
ncbi:MAG TPA: LPS assembly protein LptD [Candidatus Binatia bacterium]|nr:LPS assembly protein LptD [Candidatus Binatia bacterium]